MINAEVSVSFKNFITLANGAVSQLKEVCIKGSHILLSSSCQKMVRIIMTTYIADFSAIVTHLTLPALVYLVCM